MKSKQLSIVYFIIMFMLVWGFDLLNSIKYGNGIQWRELISPFLFTQILYGLATMMLTRFILYRYYVGKKFIRLVLAIGLLIIFFIALRYITEEIILPALTGARNYSETTTLSYYALDNIYYALVYIFLGFLVFLLDYQVGLQQKQSLLVQQNKEAELSFLRSQVSPHFLFNSLNSIYALSYKKSDKAPEAILKLSELIRYMLYEKKELIPLSDEWEYVQNLLSLQQLRYDHPLDVTLAATGTINHTQVPPYLLIPFVENVFKHGRFLPGEEGASVKLHAENGHIDFNVENTIDHRQKDKTGGIGLDNVKRRLALLYPGKHKLDIDNNENIFRIHLHIDNNKP